jgi:hypothetical protein
MTATTPSSPPTANDFFNSLLVLLRGGSSSPAEPVTPVDYGRPVQISRRQHRREPLSDRFAGRASKFLLSRFSRFAGWRLHNLFYSRNPRKNFT